MSFENFQIAYFSSGIVGIMAAFLALRKKRGEILTLSLMSLMVIPLFLSSHFGSNAHPPDTLMDEHILRVFTHAKGDLMLTLSNAFVWCITPFGFGLLISAKLKGGFVWMFFLMLVILKTVFDDYFLIHLYPENFSHSFEWGYVLFGWSMVYLILALVITKRNKFFNNREGPAL